MPNSLILLPRLDTTFKKIDSYIPEKNYDNLPLIRKYWKDFGENLCHVLIQNYKHKIEILEQPLWQFESNTIDSYIKNKNFDYVFVPHKEPHNFPIKNCRALYYMQQVFPFAFTIDPNGWGSNLHFIDEINLNDFESVEARKDYELVKDNFLKGNSKFDQPKSRSIVEKTGDWLFICQLPHDETIRFHSTVGVLDAIKSVHREAVKAGVVLYVKGHPINKASMSEIIQYCNKNEFDTRHINYYSDELSILDSIMKSSKIFTVNSGAGFESLLVDSELYHFGNSEYRNVSKKLDINFDYHELKDFTSNFEKSHFIGNFLQMTVFSNNVNSFERVLDRVL